MAELDTSWSNSAFFYPSYTETYAAVRNAVSAGVEYDKRNGYIGQSLSGFGYLVNRVALYFDTSSIPAEATVSSVVLKLWINSIDEPVEFNLVAQNGQPTYPHIPPEEGDYYHSHYSGEYGSISTESLSTGAYNNIPLDNGIVTKAGTTRIMLRSSRDIAGVEPSTYERISFNGTTHSPRIVITYSEAPAITTNAASEIGYWAAMGNGTIDIGEPTERGFEVKLVFSGTLNNYINHSIAGFAGEASYNISTGKWEGILTKTETETGTFSTGAYELVLGYPSVLGNPSSVFNDKLFKCESYTYRAYMIADGTTYYGDYVAFNTLCDSGGDQQTDDDISDGDPIVPPIPIEDEPEYPPFEWELEEPEPYPPWNWDLPDWAFPDYPPMSFVGEFYYRKPYTKKDLNDLRRKCIIYNKNSIEFALVLRHNMNVLKEFFNMMTDYMGKEEFNDFTDLIPPQRLKELNLDPLEVEDFRDMINGFIRNTIDNNMAVNRNFKLIQDGLSDYETTSDDAYFKGITSSMKTVTEDNPDVHKLKRKIDSLNQEVAFNFGNIMRNLRIIRARLL